MVKGLRKSEQWLAAVVQAREWILMCAGTPSRAGVLQGCRVRSLENAKRSAKAQDLVLCQRFGENVSAVHVRAAIAQLNLLALHGVAHEVKSHVNVLGACAVRLVVADVNGRLVVNKDHQRVPQAH